MQGKDLIRSVCPKQPQSSPRSTLSHQARAQYCISQLPLGQIFSGWVLMRLRRM